MGSDLPEGIGIWDQNQMGKSIASLFDHRGELRLRQLRRGHDGVLDAAARDLPQFVKIEYRNAFHFRAGLSIGDHCYRTEPKVWLTHEFAQQRERYWSASEQDNRI